MTDYAAVIGAIRPGALYRLDGDDYAGLTWLDNEQTQPTQAECDAAWPTVQFERDRAAIEVQRRQRYQAETDGMFFAAQREDGDLTAWVAAVDKIKADLPYPVQP